MARKIIAYTDYKSPYAYLAKDQTYALARDYGAEIEWRPYILDIPSFLGSATVDDQGKVIEATRTKFGVPGNGSNIVFVEDPDGVRIGVESLL